MLLLIMRWTNTLVVVSAFVQVNYLGSASFSSRSNRGASFSWVCLNRPKQGVFLHCQPTVLHMVPSPNKSFNSREREMEIRRQIRQLKQQGRIRPKTDELDDDDDTDALYADKIRQKLGPVKSKLLGFDGKIRDDDEDEDDVFEPAFLKKRMGQIGTVSESLTDGKIEDGDRILDQQQLESQRYQYDEEDDDDSVESEKDLLELVEQRLREKLSPSSKGASSEQPKGIYSRSESPSGSTEEKSTPAFIPRKSKITSEIGGSWDAGETSEAVQDIYQPKTGSWGAFPRPRDISKAYGGGRRVGVGYSESVTSVDETRERLQRYRQTMGIEVESEKTNAKEIEDALKIAAYAMQRGVYTQAVTSLEKVTKFCSTNSKVGGKVFLELAMAYEAAGRTEEAITVYTTLTRSRTEEVSTNAKRLLYGIEAIKFMQENVGSAEFSRKQAKMTFIDTTGLANFASNFDDVYETAYVDLDRGFYKELTEAVVRSSRDARQILLRATRPGEVGRLRIVQALRSLSRFFEDALENEIQMSRPLPEPVAIMDGKPIVPQRQPSGDGSLSSSVRQMDQYVLMSSEQMMENLDGEWRLQLIADKRGDGVKFFNSTLAWQIVDTGQMNFKSLCPQGFLTVEPTGLIEFNNKRRILRRRSIEVSGTGSVITNIFGITTKAGPYGAVCSEKQIVLVDSTLLVTRGVPPSSVLSRSGARKDDDKDYFAVWRRVDTGTYSQAS
jgi:hypothetical protein